MKVVILCGGQGIRAFPFTTYLPKPMLPLGGTPVLVHVIKNFIRQGFREFILAAGYRQDVLHDYFEGKDIGASIQIVDTGEGSDTGRRIYNCRHLIDGPFIATYGDGLSDVPLHDVVDFHRSHGKRLTITSVPMYSQYAFSVAEDGGIDSFKEKPLIADFWINAGFMVMEPTIFDDWNGENLERDIVPPMIAAKDAYTYRHDGFFKSFDSYKDVIEADEVIASGAPLPWIAGHQIQEKAA